MRTGDDVSWQRVAGVWLIRDGRVLMLRRPDGVWAPPGGVVEVGESPLEGAIRETREETGFSLIAGIEALHEFGWERQPPLYVYQFISAVPAGEVRISAEHTVARRFGPDEYVARQLSPPPTLNLPASSRQWLSEMCIVAAKADAWIGNSRSE